MSQTALAEALMESFLIEGGRPLNGRVRAAGNKNAALPILAACLLTDQPVTLENVPRIGDVDTMLELMAGLGVDVEWTGANEVQVHAADIHTHELDEVLGRRVRGHLEAPSRLDTHIHALSALGATVEPGRRFEMSADRLSGAFILLDEASVTGTENTVMAAVTAPGETVVYNAACEPHVQDLCRFLISLGARIKGIGSNRLHIEGVSRLDGGRYRIGPDHIEVASFVGLAAVTHGELVIDDVVPEDLVPIRGAFERLGVRMEVDGTSLRVPDGQELAVQDDLGGQVAKVEDGPWPAFPADLTSIALIVATQARGTILIFEKMFESRLFFVDKLVNMGARIILCDPHRAVVSGPAQLYGQRMESPDIRAGWAMLVAALCAEGTSTIGNIAQIVRGYERIEERLRAVGAQIEHAEV